MEHKVLLSGMQPTGALHLGNLEGALKNWVRLQNQYTMYCCIVDWHTLTTLFHRTQEIRPNSLEVAADYIASGLDPDKCAIFLQSDVKEHAELHLLLSMVTPLGWLERVPTFKDKREHLQLNDEQISYGLLGYPVLQAADILLYRAHLVPVGKDQAPHLELSREIARRFNNLYGNILPVPDALIPEDTGVLPGMDGRKMSKSLGNAIYLNDSADTIAKKVKSAFTTESKVKLTDPGIPETCAVCQLRRVFDPANYQTSWDEDRRGERGCSQSKKELIEILNAYIDPIRTRRTELLNDKAELERILARGADKAREAAVATMDVVRRAMGFG